MSHPYGKGNVTMAVEDQFDAFSYDTHVLDFGDGRNLNNMIISNQS